MSKFLITVMTVLCIGLLTIAAQGALVHYTFNETSSGNWNVLVQVSGDDTAGLSAYAIWVNSASGVNYTENVLGTLNGSYSPIGFQAGNLLKGYISGKYNAGNFQSYTAPISGIGKVPVFIMPPPGPPPIPVNLGVPALLGTLTTPAGLHLTTDLYPGPTGTGLFNAGVTGYLPTVTPTWEVNPIPEPATLALLAIGSALWLLGKRRSA